MFACLFCKPRFHRCPWAPNNMVAWFPRYNSHPQRRLVRMNLRLPRHLRCQAWTMNLSARTKPRMPTGRTPDDTHVTREFVSWRHTVHSCACAFKSRASVGLSIVGSHRQTHRVHLRHLHTLKSLTPSPIAFPAIGRGSSSTNMSHLGRPGTRSSPP